MKILLFGKNGQVGWELQRALAPQHTEAGARAIDTMIFDACMRIAGVPRSSSARGST